MDVYGSDGIDNDIAVLLEGHGVALRADESEIYVLILDAEQKEAHIALMDAVDKPTSTAFEYDRWIYDQDFSDIIESVEIADRIGMIKMYRKHGTIKV